MKFIGFYNNYKNSMVKTNTLTEATPHGESFLSYD